MPEPPTHVIRLATPVDADALAQLRYEFRSALDPVSEPMDSFTARCTRWMTDRLTSDSSWRCWVAETTEGIVGTLWLHLLEKIPNPVDEPENYGYVTSVYVRPAFRGSGTGARLLEVALAECDRLGVHSVFLWPTAESRTLYGRHGFAPPASLMERPSRRGLHEEAHSLVD